MLLAALAWAQSWAVPIVALVLAQTSGGGTGSGAGGGGSSGIPWGQLAGSVITPVIVLGLLMAGALRVGSAVDKEGAKREELWNERLKAEAARADRAEARAGASEERERRLRDAAEEKFLPVLNNTGHTLEKVMDFMLSEGRRGG